MTVPLLTFTVVPNIIKIFLKSENKNHMEAEQDSPTEGKKVQEALQRFRATQLYSRESWFI